MSTREAIRRTRNRAEIWLLTTALATLAPHTPHLPAWLSILCAFLLAWRAAQMLHPLFDLHRVAIVLLAVATGVGVRYEFGHFFGRDPGVALLAALLCLKLLEVRCARDIRVAVLLSLFLQLGLFFYNQTLPIAGLVMAGALLATSTLVSLHDPAASARLQLRTSGLLVLQAIPFVLVLFLLFPRVPGPLWGLPSDAYSGRSGLSETMRPGSISQLGLSDAIAFRAEFTGPPPPPALRYWRGPVLTRFDGREWRQSVAFARREPAYTPAGTRYDYQMTLEPHNRTWLFALDYADAGLAGVHYTGDFRLLLERPAHQRVRVELRSYPGTTVGHDEDPRVLAEALSLPSRSNPRSRDLARGIAAQAETPLATLERVLTEMKGRALVYTLEPPLLGTHSVDEFLFDSRRGFCEHFAAAFVFLMRASGVPARVVTGYLGGEINPVDRSVVVRQSDAHAWAEVWVAGRGWIRVDPTALAAPMRIELGLAAALPAGERLPMMMRPAMAWLRAVRHQWDALSNTWNQSVLGFDPERQRRLLEGLGFAQPDWKTLVALLGAGAAVLMGALFGWAFVQHRRSDPLDRVWARFCARLAREGMARLPWEGPIDYAERAARTLRGSGPAIRAIAASYARLRYRTHVAADPDAVRRLKSRIRSLNLRHK